MSRLLVAAVAWVALVPAAALAADPPAGAWKFKFADGKDSFTFLVHFTETDGKWVGDFVSSSVALTKEPKFANVTVTGDNLQFTLLFAGREFVSFDGVIAKDGKKITGSYSQFGGPLKLAEMLPTKLKKADDPFALARETFAQTDAGPDLFDAGFAVVAEAGKNKLPPEEVRGIADKLSKAAAGYGPRWERTLALRLATTLAGQDGLGEVAVAQVQRAERMLGDDAPAALAIEVYDTAARVLTAAGKPDQARKYAGLIAKLEPKDYADALKANLTFTPEAFAGRKAKSDRVVLVEVVNTTESPTAQGADVLLEALARTYKPADVVFLNFHVSAPRLAPDVLMTTDGMERVGGYREQIQENGFPALLVDGKSVVRASGPPAGTKEKFPAVRAAVEADLEKPAGAKLALTVTKAEKGFAVKASVTGLETPGEKMFLRFALAEERVRFAGGSGTRYHPFVVRGMPGGAKGFPLAKKTHEETVTIDPAAARDKLAKFLDEFAKETEFPRPDRPLDFKRLKVVAFVQNDATGEVLQAAQVDLDAK